MIFSQVLYNDIDDPYIHQFIVNDGVDLLLKTTNDENYQSIINHLDKHIDTTYLYGAYSALNWEKVILGAELSETSAFDTDGDTLYNWEEVDTSKLIVYDDDSYDLPTIGDLIHSISSELYRNSILKFINGNHNSAKNRLLLSAKKDEKCTDYSAILNLRYLPVKSSPINKDTDGDGYWDCDDPVPDIAPDYLDGQYDFLDGEIYSLLLDNSHGTSCCFELKNGLLTSGTSLEISDCTGEEKQRFRFKWHSAEESILKFV